MKKRIIIVAVVILAVIILGALYVHLSPLWVSVSTAVVACGAFAGGWMAKKYWSGKTESYEQRTEK